MAKVTMGGRTYEVEVKGESVVVDGIAFPVSVKDDGAHKTVKAGDQVYRVQLPAVDSRANGMTAQVDYRPFVFEYEGRFTSGPAPREPRAATISAAPRAGVKGGVAAQIAGKVITVKVKQGEAVKQGDVLLLLEAMKMENEIKAPADGTVKEILVADGQRVTEGDTLVVLE